MSIAKYLPRVEEGFQVFGCFEYQVAIAICRLLADYSSILNTSTTTPSLPVVIKRSELLKLPATKV
jgi:hypothetical protein